MHAIPAGRWAAAKAMKYTEFKNIISELATRAGIQEIMLNGRAFVGPHSTRRGGYQLAELAHNHHEANILGDWKGGNTALDCYMGNAGRTLADGYCIPFPTSRLHVRTLQVDPPKGPKPTVVDDWEANFELREYGTNGAEANGGKKSNKGGNKTKSGAMAICNDDRNSDDMDVDQVGFVPEKIVSNMKKSSRSVMKKGKKPAMKKTSMVAMKKTAAAMKKKSAFAMKKPAQKKKVQAAGTAKKNKKPVKKVLSLKDKKNKAGSKNKKAMKKMKK